VPGGYNAFGNRSDLLRGLAQAENNLRKPLTQGALVIDPGEAEILEGGLAQKLKKLAMGLLRCQPLALDIVQKGAKGRAVHERETLSSVDFGLSRTVVWPFMLRDGLILL
jgi:hypothetical protein